MLTPDSATIDGVETSDSERLQVPSFLRPRKAEANGRNSHSKHHASQRAQSSTSEKASTTGSESGRQTPEAQTPSSSSDDHFKNAPRRQNEVSEFDIREDMQSWEIRVQPR